jgi:hypothetical protein
VLSLRRKRRIKAAEQTQGKRYRHAAEAPLPERQQNPARWGSSGVPQESAFR